ncbi:hypothetical protein I8752_01925 [Nostocaceae cyanobacterium CENA369]|uniref:Sigma-70 family RNA polymerase sigma factor n=1 Tax=Dendronalium phyllosphericum CENA369 TaxID=1725256 RepID=A0A8J7I1W9_9NOST|nr:hypothetical protein [Dendronalium phyllosphericum]MBH8571805.1 hypothetical protein [Dendronalium phyllosphericum CENA369]
MCNNSPLIGLLQAALNYPIESSRLLQQPKKLQEIMNDIPARQWIFEQACQTDNLNQAKRAKDLIINMMRSSRSIWQGRGILPDVYSEALSRTWIWFMEHFDEYNPALAGFVTWFNQKLRWIIQDVIQERATEQGRRLNLPADEEDNESIYPPAPKPDRWHETIQEWLELVGNNSHQLSNCRMQSHPHVNCHVLLIDILKVLGNSGEFSWDDLAQKYGVELLALKRFCKTRCFPLFRKLLPE